MKRFLILFLPFIINSQVIQTKDTIVLDEVSVKILRESNKEELSIYSISKIDLDLKLTALLHCLPIDGKALHLDNL